MPCHRIQNSAGLGPQSEVRKELAERNAREILAELLAPRRIQRLFVGTCCGSCCTAPHELAPSLNSAAQRSSYQR